MCKKCESSDVELRVGNRSFPAHRAILSDWNSVFAERLMVFLFTERLRKMGNVDELWAAANKYNVETLERICESTRTRSRIEELSKNVNVKSLVFIFHA